MRKLPSLPLSVKVFYGVGELAAAVPASLSAFFILYFFTTVARLSPALAGGVLLFGRVWDAINDPLIGWLSDRTVSPLGRRYPWMLGGVIPLAICSVLLWIVPPFPTQMGVFAYYIVLSIFAFAAFTAVQLPYTALAAELSDDYDERTDLIGMKSAFSIGASILALAGAQVVFARVADPARQYALLGLLSASLALVVIGICVGGTYRRYWQVQRGRPLLSGDGAPPALLHQLRTVFRNGAFRQVLGLYLCGWMSVQVTAAMLPYFVGAWMGLPATHFAHHALTENDGVGHYTGNFGNLLFVWDMLFGTAHITRRYPQAYGLADDRAHGRRRAAGGPPRQAGSLARAARPLHARSRHAGG